jgi:hypothetical protein
MKKLSELLTEVFAEAVRTCEEREQTNAYGDSWRLPTGVKGTFVHAETKVERLRHQVWERELAQIPLAGALDSAKDLINYGAFMYILLQEEEQRRIAKGQK